MTLRALALAPLFIGVLAAPHAQAEPVGSSAAAAEDRAIEQARQHFTQATKLYKDGDFDAALVQFERAYELKPNYKVLYNIGQTYFQLRQYVEARDAMLRYVREGGAQIDAERQAQVTKDLADLERRIASITVKVNVSNASVLVDGKKVGSTPLPAPIPVSEGQRSISVEAPNRGVLQRLVRVVGGDQQTLNLNFEELKPLPAPRPISAAPPRLHGSSRLGAGFWMTAVGAVALGAGAGVTGYLALHAQQDNKDQQRQPGVTLAKLDTSNRHARTFALSTDILAGAAIVCASVATVIWITSPSHPAQVGLALSPRSANLVGRF